ncbi:halocyanin domain-containing protein [Halosimplex carlsbadense 2-9-1]|uniref:Halocyanin domain-containing protein n=1 Tax=Halosimplex carlsbadense 2-9-1 TaxID=797114 RepID=M0D368_9EURY|nr:halocyanin domain-containing protein [Halosimplex carlsbadense]ELZ29298.1 halocyanin domain-containing protein [Halosimplex carlsbadense 2-9-1]
MSTDDGIDEGRRDAMKTLAIGATVGGLAAAGARPAAAQSTDLTDWFSNVGNADGVVDETGKSEVTVEVGVSGNSGPFAFGPAAVRVDPGTTVVWEWTGEGTPHNVVAEDGSYESEMITEAGATFSHTFESEGVSKYACTPHKVSGMKGAVIVGDADVTVSSGSSTATASGGGGGNETSGSGSGGSGGSGDFVEPDYEGWFDGVGNYDGTVDMTGQDEVTIEVGAEGNSGPFAFGPAAVRVDPGTTVVWEWTGKGGQHNVAGETHDFESPMQGSEGDTYALELDGEGVVKYACTPHKAAGMKGAVVVGNPAAASGGGAGIDLFKTSLWGLAGAIVAAPFVASQIVASKRADDDDEGRHRGPRQPAD